MADVGYACSSMYATEDYNRFERLWRFNKNKYTLFSDSVNATQNML